MANRNMKADMNVQFTEASSRQSIESGESVKTLFGKIRKWLSDLKPVAFSGSYNDLSNKPTTGVSGVKGNSETSYRTGNVNLTPANIGLGNVNNTSDANKPISTAAQAALDGKVNKSGDTMTGMLIHRASHVALKANNLDLNGDNPSASTNGNSEIRFVDKDDQRIGFINVSRAPDGSSQLNIASEARNPADTADAYNWVSIIVGRNGTHSYGIADPAAFRNAIGLDPLGYYGCGGRTTNTATNPWVLVAETTATISNNSAITLLFEYTYTPPVNAASTGTGILSVNVRTDANGAIITDRSYVKWLTRTNELNNDDVIITYNNSTKSLQIWAKSDYAYKAFRVRPLSGGTEHSSFDISKWTFTTSLNTNMYASYPTGDGITVLTPTYDIQELTSGKLDVTGNSDTPYDDLPDHFELTTHHGNTLFIKMIPYASSNISYLLLGNDDTLQYFGIERDYFVVQTKDANSTYEFKDDGIYLNGTRIAP